MQTAQKTMPSKLEELEVMFVSGVAQPATGERFILLKDAQGTSKYNEWVKNLRAVNAPLANELDVLLAFGDYAGLEEAIKSTGNFEMADQINLMVSALTAKSKGAPGVVKTTNAKDKGAGNQPDMDDDSHAEDQAAPDTNAQPHNIGAGKKKGGTNMAKSVAMVMAKAFADAAGVEVVPAGTTAMLEKFRQAASAAAKSITDGAGVDDAPVHGAVARLDEMIAMAAQAPKTDKVVNDGANPDITIQPDILRGTPFAGSVDAGTVLMGTPFAGSVDTVGIVSGTPAQKSAAARRKKMADLAAANC